MGEIKNFTGISASYENPLNPDIVIYTTREAPEKAVEKIADKMQLENEE